LRADCGPAWSPRLPCVDRFARFGLALMLWVAGLAWEYEMTWPRWLYMLEDRLDPWFGDDKVTHWLGAAFGMLKSRELLVRQGASIGAAAVLSWIAIMIVILLVEVIELYRWERWQAKGAPQPWPWLTDRVSLKDVAWGLLGAWMATL
jgi:hypothetical protein